MARTITLLLLLLNGAVTIIAQSSERPLQKTLMGIEVHFRFDKADLDLTYMNNEYSLHRFAHAIDSIGLTMIDSVVIVSQSSPEGKYDHNMRLSQRRAATMRKTITARHPELIDILHIHPDGESWQQLREYIKNDTLMEQSDIDKAIHIIDSDVDIVAKKRHMKQLSSYDYLIETYYPRIRNSAFCIIYYEIPQPAQAPIALPVQQAEIADTLLPTIPIRTVTYRTVREKATIAALKTNLLYDAATALNIEMEIPICKRWSIMVEDVFPWWHQGNKYAFQLLSAGIEGRYWFARNWERDVLAGHFVGVYGMSGKYDLQWDHALCYQGEHWSAGLTYGYAMPIGRWFNLELSASVGYLATHYRHYRPADDYSELLRDPYGQGHLQYLGPTKLKVSLVLPIQVYTKERKEAVYAY